MPRAKKTTTKSAAPRRPRKPRAGKPENPRDAAQRESDAQSEDVATDPAAAPLEPDTGAVTSRTQRDGSRTTIERGSVDQRGHVGDDNSSLGRPRA